DAIQERQRRSFLAAGSVGVDVDEARCDDLPARVNRFGSVRRYIGIDRRDPAAGDCDVADRVEPERGIDDAPALDDQIVGRRERLRQTGKERSTGSAGADKLASIHHCERPPWRVLFHKRGARDRSAPIILIASASPRGGARPPRISNACGPTTIRPPSPPKKLP